MNSFKDKLALIWLNMRELIPILLKKHPHQLQQEIIWEQVIEKILDGKKITGVQDLLDSLNLNITFSVSGRKQDIDLLNSIFHLIFIAISKVAGNSGEILYIYQHSTKQWLIASEVLFEDFIHNPTNSGCVELAVVKGSSLISRHSITLWTQHKGAFENNNPTAKIKRIVAQEGSIPKLKSIKAKKFKAIDAVYTWVNSADPGWQKMLYEQISNKKIDTDRFAQVDELKYSLRTLDLYAPWIRKVYIFSNCEPPEWFREGDNVTWVQHSDIIPKKYLPLFNSHAIETFLHKIPDLSENFIYFNDDVFINDFTKPEDFFSEYGKSISRLEQHGMLSYFEGLEQQERLAEEWQYAALNCARLFNSHYDLFPLRLHCHTPHAFSKSVFQKLESEFKEQFDITRKAKFRSQDDLSIASFFYHHYALFHGSAEERSEKSFIVRPGNIDNFRENEFNKRYKFYCLNDGGGSADNLHYQTFKKNFLTTQYQFKSRAEN